MKLSPVICACFFSLGFVLNNYLIIRWVGSSLTKAELAFTPNSIRINCGVLPYTLMEKNVLFVRSFVNKKCRRLYFEFTLFRQRKCGTEKLFGIEFGEHAYFDGNTKLCQTKFICHVIMSWKKIIKGKEKLRIRTQLLAYTYTHCVYFLFYCTGMSFRNQFSSSKFIEWN